jgi:predicted HTH transcriptional regulator
MSATKNPNKPVTTEIVYEFIQKSNKGVTKRTLTEKTGYSNKKVEKVVAHLKKQGKIKSFLQGVYTKA